MAEQQITDEETILRMVQALPRSRQVQLAHRILDPAWQPSIRRRAAPTSHPPNCVASAREAGKRPSDEEVERLAHGEVRRVGGKR